MVATSALKAAGADNLTASRAAACDWLRASPNRWLSWVPASCPGGAYPDASLTACAACAPGAYCPGGHAPPTACPAGFYCPAAAPAPLPCPAGRTSAGPGAAAASNCTECAGDALRLGGGGCLALAVGIPVLVVVILVLAAALAALVMSRILSAEQKLWRISAADISYNEPAEVLGRGQQGVVVKVISAPYRLPL